MFPSISARPCVCASCLWYAAVCLPLNAALQINEIMVDNPGRPNDPNALLDIDGNSPGWVELYNDGAGVVDLTGWALSDDPAVPAKWVFAAPVAPSTLPTTIAAGGYKMVFCGGLARNTANVEPHTTFGLDNSGYILLSQPDGNGGWQVVSRIGLPADGTKPAAPYPNQRKGVSYGYPANNPALSPVFFPNDTPAAANAADGITEFCRDTVFDTDRGFYDTPFPLTITCATPGATIVYTLNGTLPTATNGTQATSTVPATPVASVNITGTTIIRARAIKTGMASSNVDTHTYLFASEVMTQTGPLPSMGLSANDTHLWGTSGGTPRSPAGPDWAVETGATQYPNATNRFTPADLKRLPVVSVTTAWREAFGPKSTAPDYASTPVNNRGFYVGQEIGVANEGTDRYASFEYINPLGDQAKPNASRAAPSDPWLNKGFQTDGNIHVFGGTSQQRWKSYKLSMRFKAQENVNFNLYGDDAATSQDTFILDARLNQAWVHATDATQRSRGDYVRDHVMADLQNNMGGFTFHTKPVHYFLNGLYWGLYLLHEKPDGKFMADYLGGKKEDWDVFKHSAATGVDGNTVYGLVISSGLINPALPLGSNSDASYFNCTSVKNYEEMLDTLGMGRVAPNPTVQMSTRAAFEAAAAKIDIPAFIDYILLNCVAANSDWPHKNYYASYHRTDPNGKWRWHSWDAEHVFRQESENTFTQGNWSGDGETSSRGPGAVMRRLSQNAEFRLMVADRIHQRLFNGGELSTAKLQAAFTKRLNEIDGWGVRGESARWGDNRSTAGQPYSYTANGSFPTPTWTAEKTRILNTILPARGSLTATSNSALANLKTFAGGALYPATAAPEFRDGATNNIQHGGLVPAGFTLKITNPAATGTLYFTLNGSDPREAWTGAVAPMFPVGPVRSDTMPFLLESSKVVKARVLNGTTWSALNAAFYSVGTEPASAANLVISEFSYRPGAPGPAETAAGFTQRSKFEFVELTNIGATGVSLDGVSFGAGLDYTFNATSAIREIAPGERVLIVADKAAFELRYGTGRPVAGTFQLGSNLGDSGETISLLATSQSVIKSFSYNDKDPWPEAADGGGYSLVLIKPGTNPDPALAQNWRPSVSVPGTPGGSDLTSYSAWRTTHNITSDDGDDDGDGITNPMEFFLKTNPRATNHDPILTGGVQTLDVDPGPGRPPVPGDYLTLSFRRDPGAEEVSYSVETSLDLVAWTHHINDIVRVSVTPNPDGTQTELWRSTKPVTSSLRCYGRLRVTLP
jgi:hypothetical protein